jgi:hypothetical protein
MAERPIAGKCAASTEHHGYTEWCVLPQGHAGQHEARIRWSGPEAHLIPGPVANIPEGPALTGDC